QYDSLSGFSGSLGLENNNVFGLGNTLSVNVGASRNDAGQVFSGTLGYTIPWLDIDFADFREKRTSVSFSVASNVTGNNPVLDATNTDTGRDYTVRTSGLGVSVGRSLTPSLGLSASVNTSYNSYYLEPVQKADVSSTDDATAAPLVPPSSLTTVVGAALRYDTTTSPDFPTSGLRANVYAGYGFGRSGATPLGWTKLEGGASTYFGLGRTLEKGFGSQQKQQAFAVRLNAGTLLGTTPPGLNYAIGYSNTNPAYELRGYDAAAFRGSNYLTSSAEYRYDFNLGGSIAQGLYGIAFVDAGSAWNTGSPINVGLSLGLGAQLNLGFNNSPLATVRFDYGFSPATGSGKFHFRLGPVW
ncbi:MAG: BamA/TamA family outer membrane protein, partial [Deinococcus sp.]